MLNDVEHHRALWSGREGRRLELREAARRWLEEVYEPTLALIPSAERAKLDDAEIFHQLLEHRWYLSERKGCDLLPAEVADSYVAEVLAPLPVPALPAPSLQ
jgi:hypothetical protein